MNRTRLFFIISIFLSVAFSSRAQDWEMKAVELERTVFLADDPHVANDALISKARCYRNAGRFEDASATLERIRMYLLSPEEQDSIILERALYSSMSGDVDAALSHLEQLCASGSEMSATIQEQLSSLKQGRAAKKSENKAMLLAILPPLGHFYTQNYEEGLLSAGMNILAAGWTVWQCASGFWVTGLLGGGMALNYSYMGNIDRSIELAGIYNEARDSEFNDKLRALILSHIPAE